ncbi:hypothetical protein ABBQ32_014092 [Trebouxia sp. C0010 RCD-2024]
MHSQASFAKSSPRPSQPQQNPQKATGRHKPSAHHPLLKQQRRRAKQARRKLSHKKKKKKTSTSGHEHVCGAGAIPSAGKKRDLESGSDSEVVVAGDTDALAIESFQAQHAPSLPASMTQGVITLLYKGKGSRSSLDSYRPIILLNSDYKLLAKTLATRFGPFFFFFFFFWVTGEMSIPFRQAAVKDARRT